MPVADWVAVIGLPWQSLRDGSGGCGTSDTLGTGDSTGSNGRPRPTGVLEIVWSRHMRRGPNGGYLRAGRAKLQTAAKCQRLSRGGGVADGTVIEAAGGVVWRPADRGVELAVVHRPKYDDWSLPKGKLLSGEPPLWEHCAR